MKHEVEATIANLQGCYSSDRKVILEIDSGDSIVCPTLDAGWGYADHSGEKPVRATIAPENRLDMENDVGHSLIGPIAVKGALPGQVLEVEVVELVPSALGFNVAGKGRPFADELGIAEDLLFVDWEIDAANSTAKSSTGHEVSLSPFLGLIGVCPAEDGIHSTIPPRAVGGNIDCKELTVGSKLFLPIAVEGALLSFADGHAAQGDGEVSGTAIECPMDRVELIIRVRDDMKLRWPIAETSNAWLTFGFDEDLNVAMKIALNNMLDLMEQRLGISRHEATALASVVVDLRITQIVNRSMGVHAMLPHAAIR
jgi:acetamidase/formamidase